MLSGFYLQSTHFIFNLNTWISRLDCTQEKEMLENIPTIRTRLSVCSVSPFSFRWCRCPGCPFRPWKTPGTGSRPRTPPSSAWRARRGRWRWRWCGAGWRWSWSSWPSRPPSSVSPWADPCCWWGRPRPAVRIVFSSWTPAGSCCWSHSSGQSISRYHWLQLFIWSDIWDWMLFDTKWKVRTGGRPDIYSWSTLTITLLFLSLLSC